MLSPALPNPRWGTSEGELQPFHPAALPPAPVRSCPGSEVYSSKRRAAAAACSPACLLPPAPGISPARAIASPGQNPPAWGWDRPPGTSITQYLQNLRPLPTSPPQVHTHEQRSQPVVPGLGGSLLLPQPRRGSRGNAKGMLCPARKHGRTQAAERNQETVRSTAPKICATNTCILLHMFKPN